jgi:carboxylesterase type B
MDKGELKYTAEQTEVSQMIRKGQENGILYWMKAEKVRKRKEDTRHGTLKKYRSDSRRIDKKTDEWTTYDMKVFRRCSARVQAGTKRAIPSSCSACIIVGLPVPAHWVLNPPADSGIAPVDPKNIFIMGDSAGGVKSLYFALLH